MGILGKDMFDMDRMYTNTRVEFGAAGYWVEEKVPAAIRICADGDPQHGCHAVSGSIG